MSQQRHVIKQQILDLQINADISVFELQTQISAIYRRALVPIIETVCDQLSTPEHICRIDKFTLDLGDLSMRSLEKDFVETLTQQLYPQLAEALGLTPIEPQQAGAQPVRGPAPVNQALPFTQGIHKATGRSHSVSHSSLDLISYFLTTGRLPWWGKSLSTPALAECFDQLLLTEPETLKSLLVVLLPQANPIQRLIYQFPDNTLTGIVLLLSPVWSAWVRQYLQDIQSVIPRIKSCQNIHPQKSRVFLWQSLFSQLSFGDRFCNRSGASPRAVNSDGVIQRSLHHLAQSLHTDVSALSQQISLAIAPLRAEGTRFESALLDIVSSYPVIDNDKTISNSSESLYFDNAQRSPDVAQSQPDAPLQSSPDTDGRTLPTSFLGEPFDDAESIYIQNAGLILLWPFLNRFFTQLNLVHSDQFTTPSSTRRAVLLLQYLVEISVESPEHLLPLNKLLCGLDLLEPIEAQLNISAQETTECDELLLAVIHNWSALKNTTASGLRQSFLQREGMLTLSDGQWRLQVEQKTYDILLDQLPWSIGIVKLPWMDIPISVTW